MGIIRDERMHEEFGGVVKVVEREPGECRAPWEMISVEIDCMQCMTPRELRRLGRWLQQEGKRIGREFTSKGAPRQ